LRITVNHIERRTLPGDFEPPPGQRAGECVAFKVRRHPTSSAIATSSLFGDAVIAAVWDSQNGKLLWAPEGASDIGWSPDGREAYVLVARGPQGWMLRRLAHYSWPARELQEELDFHVPSGGADALVVSPAGGLAAVIAIQGPEWYYEVLGLRPSLSQPGIGKRIDEYLLDGPIFSPDERYLVTAGCSRFVWWSTREEDEEEWQVPSDGGPHEAGWVHVHDLVERHKTRHPLMVDLPAGWQPQPRAGETDEWVWTMVWGPQFLGDRTFRLWLPDASPLDLRLPLPDTIEVPGLAQTWQGQSPEMARCLFGPLPFQPVPFAPEWCSRPVVGLAQSIAESQDFSLMPILADALEEAGCADPEILTHCREPGPHARGCWVVALVLGQSEST
jgi:hypothetical protein